MALSVTIPRAQVPALRQLLLLSKEQADELLSALRAEAPSLLLGTMARRLARAISLPTEDLTAILMMLASMYLASQASSKPREQFVVASIDAAKQLDELGSLEVDWTAAQQRINELLSCDQSLGITAKAVGVTADHERTYHRSRILTDMRPIFGDDVSKPAAAVIVHTLRVSYLSNRSSENAAFFVAMDSLDLQDLRDQIDRALEKEKATVQSLAAIGLPVLKPGDEG